MTAPVAISQRKASEALGVSRQLLARMVQAGRLRTVPGSSLVLTDYLVLEFGPSAQAKLAEHFQEKKGRRQTAQA